MPAGPLRGSRHGSSCSRSFGWARKGAKIGVISLLAAASVLSSCIGGSALQGTPVQDRWWDAPGGQASVWTRRPKAEDLGSLDPEKVPFETCLV